MRITAKVLLVACLFVTSVTPAAHATDHTVLMTGDYGGAMFFDPPIINIHTGDRIRWMNNVAILIHTSTSGAECAPDGLWTTGSIGPGESSAYVTFNAVGTFDYYCRFHCEMGMTGQVEVTQPPLITQQSTWGRVKALYSPARRP